MKSSVTILHGYLPVMPPCDLAVVCGDIFPGEMDRAVEVQGAWFRDVFMPWVEKIQGERVILIAGNHDYWIEENNQMLLTEFTPFPVAAIWMPLCTINNSGVVWHYLKPSKFVKSATLSEVIFMSPSMQ